jgi:hypothetical protein
MDKNLESYLLAVSRSLFSDPQDLKDVVAFIKNRRVARGYGRSPKWLAKALVTSLRGSLARFPEKHMGEDAWKRQISKA